MNNRLDEWIKHTTDPVNVGSAHCQTPDMALTDGGVDLMWQLKKQEWTFHVFFLNIWETISAYGAIELYDISHFYPLVNLQKTNWKTTTFDG
jgi:hypothetical protein